MNARQLLSALDGSYFVRATLGYTPDPKQEALLTTIASRVILNCSRQWGKSTVTAWKALHRAWHFPKSEILVASPSERQSGEFLHKTSKFLLPLGIKPEGDGYNRRSLIFPNGSRIVGIPCNEATVRGFSGVHLLIIDEAAVVPDPFYRTLRPMLATTNGDLWLISTPHGQRGFFYTEWTGGGNRWLRVSVPAPECARISTAFLQEERESMADATFRQEYMCEFTDIRGALFPASLIDNALTREILPLTFRGL
ncbi:MAG TPA: terminase family protein [Bryobacteraceae bacterium]|nr:terminase family protein [Bryobacteraceae bacterium]